MRTKLAALLTLSLCSACGSNSVSGILCGSGHAQGKMTVGLNLPFFDSQAGGTKASGISDEALKSFLNDGLSKASIDPNLLSVKSVESVISGDHVRFLQLGGTFGAGFGVASSLVKKAFSSEKAAGGPFSFLNEDFNVSAATHHRHKATDSHPSQWAYEQTRFDDAMSLWNELRNHLGGKESPVVVAVLDTGVDLDHPDLKGVLVEGYDALDSGTGTQDENGHGTHCAGIIAAERSSEQSPLGVASVAGTKIMPIKVLGKDGAGSFQAIEKGIRYAASQGVDVISLSLGAGLEFDQMGGADALQNGVIREAIEQGIIVVVAAGNENCQLAGECKGSSLFFSKSYKNYTVVPCAYEGSICVGASDADETLAEYSNYSSKREATYRTKADVNAPGTAIYSTWPTNLGEHYKIISGTSMATPYVAGIAALLKSLKPTLTQSDFMAYLERGMALPEEIVEKSEVGRVDLYATLVAFAHDSNLAGAPAEETPQPNPVEAPEVEGGATGDALIGTLLNAVCR